MRLSSIPITDRGQNIADYRSNGAMLSTAGKDDGLPSGLAAPDLAAVTAAVGLLARGRFKRR